MTNCAKCGAELIGNKKFCAACGTPVTDPRNVGSAPGAPAAAYGGAPSSQVNPFAATAFPGGKKEERPSLYGPPPELAQPVPAAGMPPLPAESSQMTGPSSTGQVSPLAVSNALSQRPAEVQSAVSAAQSIRQPPSTAAQQPPRPPGTAQMASVPKQSVAQPVPSGKKGGTQMMSPVSYAQAQAQKQQASAPASTAASPPAPPAAPSSSGAAPAQPGSPVIASPVPFPAPPQPYAATPSPYNAPMPGQAPVTPQNPWSSQQPWSAPASPYGAYGGASFGYTPGTHVMVTWANGQRYPGTIHHVQGTRCLVVFPDGQQHWVEMQYIAPV